MGRGKAGRGEASCLLPPVGRCWQWPWPWLTRAGGNPEAAVRWGLQHLFAGSVVESCPSSGDKEPNVAVVPVAGACGSPV